MILILLWLLGLPLGLIIILFLLGVGHCCGGDFAAGPSRLEIASAVRGTKHNDAENVNASL